MTTDHVETDLRPEADTPREQYRRFLRHVMRLHRVLNVLLEGAGEPPIPYTPVRFRDPASVTDVCAPALPWMHPDGPTEAPFVSHPIDLPKVCPQCRRPKLSIITRVDVDEKTGIKTEHYSRTCTTETCLPMRPYVPTPPDPRTADYQAHLAGLRDRQIVIDEAKEQARWNAKLRALGMPQEFADRFALAPSTSGFHTLEDREFQLPDHRGEERTPEEYRRQKAEVINLVKDEVEVLASVRDREQLKQHPFVQKAAQMFEIVLHGAEAEEADTKRWQRLNSNEVKMSNIPYDEMKTHFYAIVETEQGWRFYELAPEGADPKTIMTALDSLALKKAMKAYENTVQRGATPLEGLDAMQRVHAAFGKALISDPEDVRARSVQIQAALALEEETPSHQALADAFTQFVRENPPSVEGENNGTEGTEADLPDSHE